MGYEEGVGAGKSRDHRSHDADRAGTGDENILSQYRKRECRVNRISERIEDRSDLTRDGARVLPYVHHWQDNVFGERACAVHSHALRVCAQVTPACETVAAPPAYDVPLPADKIAGVKIRHVGSHFDNLPAEFMPDDKWHVNFGPRPIVPLVNMQLAASQPRAKHANLHIIDTGFRLGNIFEPETWRVAPLNKTFHPAFPPASPTSP